ncbi:MAG: hypothetical protein WC314_22950 [Vulcanimicrobiota bacterium]
MSEIRFNPTRQCYPTGHGPSLSGLPQTPTLAGAPGGPSLSPAPLSQLISGPAAGSSLSNAAPLLRLQSQTAQQITNPGSERDSHDIGAWETFKGASSGNAVLKALTRASSRLGQGARGLGSVAGLAGSAIALPGGISSAVDSIKKAWQSGEGGDIARASGDSTSALSTGTRLVKHGLETYSLGAKGVAGHLARRAGSQAFRQAAPKASKTVVKAAAKTAAKQALAEAGDKAARRGVTAAATAAAKGSGTLAKGAGVAGRTAAKTVLKEGGEAAAKAAGKAVAKGALKSGAKAAGRFVPGLNVAIAGLDTATAAATLADPKASTGKKVTSVVTAAGSIVAATNIPVVSQVGAAVSTVSSFIGSFF